MAITEKSVIERLKVLKSLYEAGILTKEEMESEKAEILYKVTPDSYSKFHGSNLNDRKCIIYPYEKSLSIGCVSQSVSVACLPYE